MRNIKLTLEYDGSDFCGWQYQPQRRTVQGELESALSRLTQETIQTTVAGRTDAGVHALGQVVNFLYGGQLSLEVLQRGGNALLPPDVRIVGIEEVGLSFNARFDAVERHYRYYIRRHHQAIGRQYSWLVPYELDVEKMHEAVSGWSGEIDFRAFCQAGAEVPHHRCFIYHAAWQAVEDKIIFDIMANRFLHNMVRIIVGSCIEIGRGRWPVHAIQEILASGDRRRAGPTAPAHGLFLIRVGYAQSSLDGG